MVQVIEQDNGAMILLQLNTSRKVELQPADSGWIDETTPQSELEEFFVSSEDEYN